MRSSPPRRHIWPCSSGWRFPNAVRFGKITCPGTEPSQRYIHLLSILSARGIPMGPGGKVKEWGERNRPEQKTGRFFVRTMVRGGARERHARCRACLRGKVTWRSPRLRPTRSGGNGVDRSGGAQPRNEDYGVRGSSVNNGILFWRIPASLGYSPRSPF
jgi:hypothetical protein